MPSKADPARALSDILENIGRIEAYVAGLDQEALGRDALRRDAVERCLERLCEAAFRLGDHASQLAPHQPWADIREVLQLSGDGLLSWADVARLHHLRLVQMAPV